MVTKFSQDGPPLQLPTDASLGLNMETDQGHDRDGEQPQHAHGIIYPGTFQSPIASSDELIDWTGTDDAENPFNWPASKKWRVTILACVMTFFVQINGTEMTSAAEQINASFNVSDEYFPHSYWPVLSWNLGGAAAPMLALPLMENFGLRWSYLVSPHSSGGSY
jgi:hypothetical protein